MRFEPSVFFPLIVIKFSKILSVVLYLLIILVTSFKQFRLISVEFHPSCIKEIHRNNLKRVKRIIKRCKKTLRILLNFLEIEIKKSIAQHSLCNL